MGQSYNGVTETADLLPMLLNNSGSVGTRTASLITSHSERVKTIIDAFIINRYDITQFGTAPTDAVPPIIRTVAMDITAFRVLRASYPRDTGTDNEWVDRFEDAKEVLKGISKGEIRVANTAGTMFAERKLSTKLQSSTQDYAPVFMQDDPLNWRVDEDRITNINELRDN